MRRTSYMYLLVEERRRQDMRHLSSFHLIDSDEFLLLRSLMALQLFPSIRPIAHEKTFYSGDVPDA
jgi:hypothetical protein